MKNILTFLAVLLISAIALAQTTTLTINGKPYPFDTMVVSITGDPVDPPPVDPPPVDPPPVDPPPVDPPPTDCGPIPPNGRSKPWEDRLMFQVAFPGPKSRQNVIGVPRNGWFAAVFNTGNHIAKGGYSNFEAASSHGSREISISKCPGDFDVPDECWRWVGASQVVIPWSTYALTGYCVLDRNTTYYANVRFYNPCTGQFCNTTLRATNRDY